MAPVPLPGTATSIETFCTTPSVHNIDQLMDYTTEDGSNLYKLASMPLKTKFDLPAANTLVFIDQLRDRAQVVGWDAGSYQITKYQVQCGNCRKPTTPEGPFHTIWTNSS